MRRIGRQHCLFVLRFYGPVNPMGSCRARSVYLTTRLLGRLSLSGSPVLCTFFRQKLTTALLESAEKKNERRKYFMINLHERMLPTSAGVEPATSWSPVGRRIQLSHRALYINCLSTKFYSIPLCTRIENMLIEVGVYFGKKMAAGEMLLCSE